MAVPVDYTHKFESFKKQTLFEKLDVDSQGFIKNVFSNHQLTFQEFRQIVEASRDLSMWREGDLEAWWQTQTSQTFLKGLQLKKHLLQTLQLYLKDKRKSAKKYPANGLPKPEMREKKFVTSKKSDKKIYGMCPVASEDTVCCNLRTIDAVENCAFGCSYCTIQTFYSDEFAFDSNFVEKLRAVPIEPDRFYHFGTGQSSDSLVWGNKNGILKALCQFATDHPNVLLEFKTKSNNIRYFLDSNIPSNVVCSWSLNTPTIVRNEEHFTATLEQRIEAARRVADKGIKVAFHFHPMVYYAGWEKDYPGIAEKLLTLFQPDEVSFISFGSVTMIKPAIKKIRQLGHPTKILQMEMVPDPHGKLTYPDELKVKMFKTMHSSLSPWHEQVFMYLCMEKASIWQQTFGFVYKNNEVFEKDFALKTMNYAGAKK